jgi:hypothetical protein
LIEIVSSLREVCKDIPAFVLRGRRIDTTEGGIVVLGMREKNSRVGILTPWQALQRHLEMLGRNLGRRAEGDEFGPCVELCPATSLPQDFEFSGSMNCIVREIIVGELLNGHFFESARISLRE